MKQGKHPTGSTANVAGVCHRCGWRGMVTSVSARNREALGTGREYGRLCEECVTTLLARTKSQPSAGARRHGTGSRGASGPDE